MAQVRLDLPVQMAETFATYGGSISFVGAWLETESQAPD